MKTHFTTVKKVLKVNFMLSLFFILFLSLNAMSQTHPTPQALPYTQDFSGFKGTTLGDTIGTEISYPAGWQGWKVAAAAPNAAGRPNVPLADVKLIVGTAENATTGLYDFNGKIGFLSSGTDLALCLAVNTTGKSNIKITFDAMTMRSLYDGITATTGYQYGLLLQYRVGTGTTLFTNLAYLPAAFNTGSTIQSTGTNGVNIATALNAVLPASCDNQPNVQIRWICRNISGASPGTRPSVALDNISVKEDNTLSNNADLASLSIDEKANNSFVPLTMFGASTYDYNYYLVKGNPVPVISGVKSQSGATTVVTQATSLTGTDAEKTAKIEVTAQDGTTKKTYSVKFIETDNVFQSGLNTSGTPVGWSQSGMFFSNSIIDGNNKFEGSYYTRCLSASTASNLRLPQTNSVGNLRFYAKKIDANVVGNFKVSKKINAGEWTVVQDLGDITNSTYQEFSVAVNETAADSMFVRIEITKNGSAYSSAGYYIDDISYTAGAPNAVINPLSDTKINVLTNTVIINGAVNKNLLVVTLTGQTLINRKVYNDSETIYLPTGFYVLSVGNERHKIRINKN